MKTHHDPRHLKRIQIMQELFAWDFDKKFLAEGNESLEAKQIVEKIAELDKQIEESAPAWPIDKINKIDLAILRLAVFELLIDQKNPVKVIVDEAVEIGKEFGSESSGSFVNGVLGKVIDSNKLVS